jgi:hypothetical protein
MRNNFRFFLLITFLLILYTPAQAKSIDTAITDPSEIGVGARPLGMGMAFAGVANDGSAIYINPAGLASFKNWKITSMSGTLLQDVQYFVLGGAYPFTFGTLGLGYINVGVPRIPITVLNSYGTPEFTGKYTDYTSGLFFISYGSKMDRFVSWNFAKDIDLGLSGKIFFEGFSGGGASLEGASGMGFDMDLGARYRPNKWASIGMNLMNVLPSGLGGKLTWPATDLRDEPLEESISMTIKTGGALKVLGEEGLFKGDGHDLVIALDLDMYPTTPKPSVWHLGCEWWATNALALRLGFDQQPSAFSTGPGVESNLTGGVGIKYRGFTFDYAYHQYGDVSENATHFFSLGYVGEDEPKKEKVAEVIKPVTPAMPEPVVVVKPKPKLRMFIDVPDGYWAQEAIEYLATIGVIEGYPDQTFRPEQSLTRAEFSAVLARARGIEPQEIIYAPYPDLPATHWSAKYVKVATDMDLVSGYPDGNFQPFKPVTRAEGILIVDRFASMKEDWATKTSPYPDLPASHWAFPGVIAATEAGILEFLAGKNFEPNRDLTRAEAAEILSKTKWGKDKIRELLSNGVTKEKTVQETATPEHTNSEVGTTER